MLLNYTCAGPASQIYSPPVYADVEAFAFGVTQLSVSTLTHDMGTAVLGSNKCCTAQMLKIKVIDVSAITRYAV